MRTSALFGAKVLRFFEIYGMSAWTKGVLQMRTSALFGAKVFRYFEIYDMSS